MKIINLIVQFVLRIFASPAAEDHPLSQPSATTHIVKRLRRNKRKNIKDLLDRLDEYFEKINALEITNRHADSIFKKVGAYVTHSDEKEVLWGELEDAYKQFGLPSHTFTYFDFTDEELIKNNRTSPVFVYSIKIKNKADVEIASGDVYEFGMYYRLPNDKVDIGWGEGWIRSRNYVEVKKDNTVRVLKSITRKPVVVPHRGRKKNTTTHCYYQNVWEVNDYRDPTKEEHMQRSIEQHVKWSFTWIMNLALERESMPNIVARKNGLRATFGIEISECKDFFSKRITATTKFGRKKPILHWVSAHKRSFRTHQTSVSTALRGCRDFLWNGYHIKINISGLHTPILSELHSATEELELSVIDANKRNLLTPDQFGEKVATVMDG